MSFLYPSFLYGLFAVSIPIIIHLFNFRRYKKVYFTNVKFLREFKQESESKSKLRHLLILLARILAIVCLVLAFAQPYIPSNNSQVKHGNKAISVFVDNSFSMEAINKNGHLLDNAKNKAKEIVSAFQPTDRFQLLTNDFEGNHQRLMTREEFIEAVDEIKISPAYRKFSEIYKRQTDLLQSAKVPDKKMFIISDFQKNILDFSSLTNDTLISTVFIPLTATQNNNVYIDTCWFVSPLQQTGMTQRLHVVIKNSSNKQIENASIKLFINKQQISPATYSIDPNGKVEVEFTFLIKQAGIQNCSLELEDNPVTFDDKLYFTFETNNNIPCLVVQGEQSKAVAYLKSLMQNDSLYSYTEYSEKSLDYSSLQKNNFLILNELNVIPSGMAHELNKYVQNGGSLLVFPSPKTDLISYNEFLSLLGVNTFLPEDSVNTKVDKINFEQGLFNDVFEKQHQNIDLPKVFNHYPINKSSHSKEEVILKLLNDQSFLSLYKVGKGKLYLCSSPLDDNYSNFARHALFVPSIIKMAINSKKVFPLFYKVGSNEAIEMNPQWKSSNEQSTHIVSVDNKIDFIPETRMTDQGSVLFTQNQVKDAGNYFITENKQTISGLSFNYARLESDLTCVNSEELNKMIEKLKLPNFRLIDIGEKNITGNIVELSEGKTLWKLFIILTLVFLAIEILLIRLMK